MLKIAYAGADVIMFVCSAGVPFFEGQAASLVARNFAITGL